MQNQREIIIVLALVLALYEGKCCTLLTCHQKFYSKYRTSYDFIFAHVIISQGPFKYSETQTEFNRICTLKIKLGIC